MAVLWTNDQDAKALLPQAGAQRNAQLHVVLFFARHDEDNASLLARFDALPVPATARAVAVDLDGAPEVARWFGIQKTPALAAVSNGALLALEDECAADACQCLIDFAAWQLQSLADEGGARRELESLR